MTIDLQSTNKPLAQHLKPEQVDNVARALLSLTKDVCVLTDRLAILEKILDEKGMDVSALIDTYQPDDALKKDIRSRTEVIIKDVVSALKDD